ncbi:MAG: acyl-CoA dehydrogenase family protein [Candidatus Bathyarchaeia archaeon]
MENFWRPDHLIREEIKIFCNTLRDFINREVLPHEDEIDDYWDWTERKEHTWVEGIFKKLWIDLGLQRAFVPPQYGGIGDWSMVETGAVVIEVARGDHGLAETAFISSWAVASAMLPTPKDNIMKQIAEWLCGNEPFVICSAITEPHGGGAVEDLRLEGLQIRTTARLEGGEWVINGHKLWPSAFREAKVYLVICRVEGEKFPNNIAQILVPADAPGVTTSKPYRKMGTALDTNGDVWFDNVRVPKENRLHDEGIDEVKSLTAKETIGRCFASAFAIGCARRAYEILKSYVESRETAGKPMKEHGLIAHELGQILQDMQAAEQVFWNSLERLDHPEVYGPPWDHKQLAMASLAQNIITEHTWQAVNRALEIMGSYGYSKEGKIEKILRDLKVTKIVVGGPVLRLLESVRYFFGTKTI